jgi:hypothetical protein
LHHDGHLIVFGQVIDLHVEHEAVELSFGKRISSLHLDRILRRQYEERFLQHVAHAANGDLMFLHRLQQGGLRLGGRAVDLVGQNDVAENRSLDELHAAMAVGRLFEDFGAGDVGWHQVGRELDTLKLKVENLGDGAHQERFRQARRAGDQAMAAGKQTDQELLDHLLLADDDFRKLGVDALAAAANQLDDLLLHLIDIKVRCHRVLLQGAVR